MDKLFENAKSRSDRILAEKLRFLYQGVAAVPANLAVACIVALLLRKSYPVEFLRLWLASTLFVAGLRLIFSTALHQRHGAGRSGVAVGPLHLRRLHDFGTVVGRSLRRASDLGRCPRLRVVDAGGRRHDGGRTDHHRRLPGPAFLVYVGHLCPAARSCFAGKCRSDHRGKRAVSWPCMPWS